MSWSPDTRLAISVLQTCSSHKTGLQIKFDSHTFEAVQHVLQFTVVNKCKNNSLVNGLRFVFLTQKESVHKSRLLMKPTTLGALRARATIEQFSERRVFLLLFSVTLSSPRLKNIHLYFIM